MHLHPRMLLPVIAAAMALPTHAAPAPLVPRLEPLSIRGVNYYPRETSWGGMWTATSNEAFEKDMALAASLGANTVRTFLHFSTTGKLRELELVDETGKPTPAYLAKVDALLDAAWKYRIRVILCLEPNAVMIADSNATPGYLGALGAVYTRFGGDGRLLMWDLLNEPDDRKKWNSNTMRYLDRANALAKEKDPRHLTTIGFGYRTDLLVRLSLPDVLQYHEYAPTWKEIFPQGPARIIKSISNQIKVGGDRSVILGEFGMPTGKDPKYGADPAFTNKLAHHAGTEAEQARLYEIVLKAAEETKIAGVLAWCLHDFPIKDPNEGMFGLVRGDGSLKPAAVLLKETFGRWAKSSKSR